MKFPKKYLYLGLGFLLGLGAPATHVFLQMMHQHGGLEVSLLHEFHDHGFLISLITPFPFTFFGLLLGILEDRVVSQKISLQRMAIQLERQSMTDDLTGLYNHRHILMEVDREVERANRYGRLVSGMMIDVDDFKKVNDQCGHLAGDIVLREVAEVLLSSIRKVDILGRYGGDEFLVILPETTGEASRVVAERIQRNIRQHSFRVKEIPLSLTVSIGLFSFPPSQKLDTFTFIDRADQVMLQAKKSGKNAICEGCV